MVAAAPTTIASPRPARRTSRRFPSRNAAASCIGKRDSGYGISSGSTNEIPAAKRKNAAGPANGNHRRANTGSTRIASAGRQNHSVVVGAPDEPRPSTTSSIATIASSAISRSNQYMRARCSTPLTHRTYPTSSRTTSHKVRPGIPLKYYPPPNRQPGDDAAPATPRPNGAHTLADDAHTAYHWRAHDAAATRGRTRRRNRYRSVPRARCQDSRIAAAAQLIKNDRFRSANCQRRPGARMPVPTSNQGAESKRWLVPLLATCEARRVVGRRIPSLIGLTSLLFRVRGYAQPVGAGPIRRPALIPREVC